MAPNPLVLERNRQRGANGSLDKLAQLVAPNGDAAFRVSKNVLRKKGQAKYFTNYLTQLLRKANPKSPLLPSYLNTFYCSHRVKQDGNKLTAEYCNNRWCMQCNRIRTGKLINGYKPLLSNFYKPQFVTLTRPNVKDTELRDEIRKLQANIKIVQRRFVQKFGRPLTGIKKLECTYNANTRTYHPHFHLLLAGGPTVAIFVRREWLRVNDTARCAAQDIREAHDSIELFKYFTKIVAKVRTSEGFEHKIYPKALDCIFQAMRGLRVYQPLNIKRVEEDVDQIQSQHFDCLNGENADGTTVSDEWLYDFNFCDWVSQSTGELLSQYVPTEAMKTLVNPTGAPLGQSEQGKLWQDGKLDYGESKHFGGLQLYEHDRLAFLKDKPPPRGLRIRAECKIKGIFDQIAKV